MALGDISDFYGPEDTFANLSRQQSGQSINQGYEAARLADPFANERKQYQNSLRDLVTNPGSFSSSPFYKFAYDQGLNALQRKGGVRSGNKLAALMSYGQDRASQSYFPQAQLLSTLAGATTGSPAAAGLAVSGAFNRSQDQASLAAAQRAAGQNRGSAMPAGGGYSPGSYAPSSGAGANYYPTGYVPGSGTLPKYGYGAEPVYQPISGAGTGYVSSDYGTTTFGGGGSYAQSPYANQYPSYIDDGYRTYGMGVDAIGGGGGGDTGPWYGGYGGYDSGYGGYGGGLDYTDYGYGSDYGGGYDDYSGDYGY